MMTRRRFSGSLRVRFLVVFGALAVVPLVATAFILGGWTADRLEEQSVALQREVAGGVASQIDSLLTERATELALLDSVFGLGAASADDQRAMLRQLAAAEPMYIDIAVVDSDGQETIRVASASVVLDTDLRVRTDDPAYVTAVELRDTGFGSVVFNDGLREPVMSIAEPILDRRSGEVDSVVLATITFKPVWELLGSLAAPEQDVYVVDADGVIVAHKDPTVVLLKTPIEIPGDGSRTTGLNGEPAVAAAREVLLGEDALVVIAEEPLDVALAVANRSAAVTLAVTAFALLAVIGALVVVTHKVVRPIQEVAASARRLARGDRSRLIAARGNDEITELAVAFNQMTLQLSDLIENLEARVAERTSEIEAGTKLQQELIAELEVKNAELVVVKEQLEELVRAKDEFLGAVSHELRTPLTSVVGFASLIRDHRADLADDERGEMVERIVDQAQDMADIINDLLVAARVEGGSLIVQPETIDVRDAVERVAGTMRDETIDLTDHAHDVTAYADPVRLRQILRNLLVNGIRYGEGNVEVAVGRSAEVAVVEVRDHGAGVPRDQWEAIFDPYRRAANNTDHPASVGLGLSVSRSLARGMGGDLTYRYEDGMSVFTLTLPLTPHAADEAAGVGGRTGR